MASNQGATTKITVRAQPRADNARSRTELNSGILPGNVHADDWVIFVLALGSVGLLGYQWLAAPAHQVGIWLFYADCALAVLFLAEFAYRWHRRGWDVRFLVRNWYEILAIAPAAHPVFVHQHQILAGLALILRIGRAADRALGEQFTYRLVDKLSEPIVYAIKKPITVAVLDEVVKVLETGNYPENLARSLTANKNELQAIIQEKITEDRQLGRLRHVPFHDEIVRTAVETSFRVVLEVLQDPRVDDFFSAVVRDNREQIRSAVELGLNEEDDTAKERVLPTRPQRTAAREFDERHPRR